MSWVQVKSPNLNVQTSIGMCLKYVQDAYGSGWAGSYALQGWQDIVKKKHYDWNIPRGVYVPIWFEGYWNGVNYGHVAIYKDGICWSSPYTNKRSHDRLGSIQEVERIYGMKYIGWSEDIGGTIVIREEEKKDEKIMVDQMVSDALYKFYLGHGTSSWGMSNAIGKMTAQQLQIHLLNSDAYKELQQKAKTGDINPVDFLPARLKENYIPKGATELRPGTYIVK